jgi:hypothetical protein
MKFCGKCKVSVAGERKYCPLCQGKLQDGHTNNDDDVFPEIPTVYRQYHFFFRVLILLSVAACAISILINALLPVKIWWSLFVVGGIGCFWLSMAISISKRKNMPKNILYQLFVVSILTVLWDLFTGWHAWSIEFVIPITCTLAMLSMAIIAKVSNLQVKDYIIYLIIDCVFGIVPLIFIFTGFIGERFPSLICAVASVISLAAVLVFQGEDLLAELRRRLHL